MISPEIAKEFISALGQFSSYRITIFDDLGNLVCSTHPQGLGAASKRAATVAETGSMLELDDGSLTYVVLPIEADHISCGCIELTGRGPDIHAVAAALKMSLEIRLKIDAIEAVQQHAIDKNERVIREIIFGGVGHPSVSESLERAGFSCEIPRQVLLLEPCAPDFIEHFSSINITFDSPHDLAAVIDGGVVVLKDVSHGQRDMRPYLEEYSKHIEEDTPFSGLIIVGSLSTSNEQLRKTYRMLIWLRDNADRLSRNAQVLFLSDYLSDYFMSMVPREAYADVFEGIESISKIDKVEFVAISDALIRNNFNLVKASQELFMHKNTVVYKLNKYKKLLSIDPMASSTDRSFMRYLSFYLRFDVLKKGGTDERD